MKRLLLSVALFAGLVHAAALKDFRPPAVPLVAHDPYFSIWSMADRLTDEATKHWTGTVQSLTAMVRIDGRTYRIMGRDPQQVPAMPQTRLQVLPTRTIYEFEVEGLHLTFTFLTPALPNDLDILSRPLTYLVWEAKSVDGKDHVVSIYFDASAELVVNTPDQPVAWSRFKLGELSVLRMGSQQQLVLGSPATTCASTGATSTLRLRQTQAFPRSPQTARRPAPRFRPPVFCPIPTT